MSVKLAAGEPLDRNDRAWLSTLLTQIQDGKDVRDLFFETVTGRPDKSMRLFWIAADVKRLRLDMIPKAAYTTVAERWALSPGRVESIWKEWKTEVERMNQESLLLVEWYRKRLRKGEK